MKNFLLLCAALFCLSTAHAQLNMELRSTVTFNQGELNDVWGWTDEETGKEYAIVGRTVGTSVIDVSDPDNPVDVGFFPGANSTWRDIKTWGDYAYVTNESGLGVAVLYLGDLPEGGELTAFNWEPNIPGLGQLNTCHNIYIDEFGYAYLAGCDLNSGGMLIIDVFSNPGSPEFVAAAPAIYSHDVYVRDNLMYSSEIYEGVFTVYDVTNKQNISDLGSQPTPFNFTHNAWLSDDGNTLFTTDELANAPVGAYDVSDPSDIEELDQFLPLATIGNNVIPHNVHVWQDWLIISYYTDGGIIVDASEPDNLIEVGNWDTFLGGDGGFSGAWGAYPFLPSETILLTDITEGLFICTPTYVRACRIEGNVTDGTTGNTIAGAEIEIQADQLNATTSDFTGEYKTGIATAGTYTVTCSAPGYDPVNVELTLENGVTVMQDFVLGATPTYSFSGLTVKAADNSNLANAQVAVFNNDYLYETTSDNNGNFALPAVPQGSYTVVAGKWGYEYGFQNVDLNGDTELTVELSLGYQDDFLFDLGWTTSGNASAGLWALGAPVGTSFEGDQSHPGADVDSDYGSNAYTTGNGGGSAGNDDVDDGNVVLTSPVMDLSASPAATLNYRTWFFNEGGNSTPNDEMTVSISNGTEQVVLETIDNSFSFWRPMSNFVLADYIELTDNMRLIVETSDQSQTGHLVEAGFDEFRVTGIQQPSAIIQTADFAIDLSLSPNPFVETARLDYVLDTDFSEAQLIITNQLGQDVNVIKINNKEGNINLGADLGIGVYFVRLIADGKLLATDKLIKTR